MGPPKNKMSIPCITFLAIYFSLKSYIVPVNSRTMKNNIAVIGATGLVGKEQCQILSEHHIRSGDFYAVSRGMENRRNGCVSIESALKGRPKYVFFCAGTEVSLEWAPKFIEIGATVIDKSDAFRRDLSVPLIVPEVNGHLLTGKEQLIASPNCSTIQLVMALYPLELMYRIKRVIVATYQSISGGGKELIEQWNHEQDGTQSHYVRFNQNVVPLCGNLMPDGSTSEEEKLGYESSRILGRDVPISATAARVSVERGHSEAVNIEFCDPIDVAQARRYILEFPGIEESNDNLDPFGTARFSAGRDSVFVSRIRRDKTVANGLNLWIVADNLRKGAALNAYQIMELVMRKRREL